MVNYTKLADEAFQPFAAHKMHLVRSTEMIDSWADFPSEL